MPYNERLNKLIDESGMQIKEIAERCKSYGVNITAAYISSLKNTRDKNASDEVSLALARACKAKDENILVIENYIDRAPIVMQNYFEYTKEIYVATALMAFTNKVSDSEYEALRDSLSNSTIADFVSMMCKQDITKTKKEINSNNIQSVVKDEEFTMVTKLTEPMGLQVSDDTMKPILKKGDKVNLEAKEIEKYKNSDILCFVEDSKPKEIQYRKCLFNDDRTEVTMFTLVSDKVKHYKIKDIKILGAVKRVIRSIENM